MNIRSSLLLALFSLLLPLASVFAQSDQTAVIIHDDFSPMRSEWQPVSGTWSVASGTYGNAGANPTDLTTITHYPDLHPAGEGNPVVVFEDFTVSARVRNSGTADTHLVGLVYGYQDFQNYYEVVISALGNVRMRTVMNGVAVDQQPVAHLDIPRNTWTDMEVRWVRGVASLKVNGIGVGTPVSQAEFTTGRIGLVTHGAVGRFDNVVLVVPFGDQDFLETFDIPLTATFEPLSGQWSVVNGTYRDSAVQQTDITLAPIHSGCCPDDGDTFEYTFRARMLNPYGASGNLIGIVFNYRILDYTELVFSPTGVIKLNRFENGTRHTVATANFSTQPNLAFEVTLENGPLHFAVVVNGQRFFENVLIFDVNPEQFPEGRVGLITHWSPGRFDNVEFNEGFFVPCSETFDNAPFPHQIISGTWDVNGGTLNSTAVGVSDLFDPQCFSGNSVHGNRFVYSARLRNEFDASGNLIGLIFNSVRLGDYNEVTFSPTGVVQLNKFIQGVRYPIASGTYNVPRNTWFKVRVRRNETRTSIFVNGTPVIQGAVEAQLRSGFVALVTHWTKGHFDDLSVTELVVRPPSEL